VLLEANPVETWNDAGAVVGSDRWRLDRKPCRLRPAFDWSGNCKISPSWFSAVMRQTRRVAHLLFVECIRNPRTARGQPILSLREKYARRKPDEENLRLSFALQREQVDRDRACSCLEQAALPLLTAGIGPIWKGAANALKDVIRVAVHGDHLRRSCEEAAHRASAPHKRGVPGREIWVTARRKLGASAEAGRSLGP